MNYLVVESIYQNRMKNTAVEKIRYWSALVGQLGRSKYSRCSFKYILRCSLPNVTPITNFTQIGFSRFSNRKKDKKKSAEIKLSELERGPRSYWIRNYFYYFSC